jgi:MtN3 and saliva related transmembrane protein
MRVSRPHGYAGEMLPADMWVEWIGMIAGALTTGAFVPQLVKTWRAGGQGLSWTMLALFGTGVGLWFVYGVLRGSWPVILANGLTGAQVVVLAGMKGWQGVRKT